MNDFLVDMKMLCRREQRRVSAGRQRKRNNYPNPGFIHASSTKQIQIQGKGKNRKLRQFKLRSERLSMDSFRDGP